MIYDKRMNAAIRVARAISNQKFRLGCVIFRGKNLISLGFNNMTKTHPKASRYRTQTIHAELAALIGTDSKELRGSIAFVARIGLAGNLRLAKPCKTCEIYLREYGLRGVWYTVNDATMEYMKF